MEMHLPVPDEHQASRSLLRVDRKDRSVDERQLDVFSCDREVAGLVLLRYVEPEPVQALHRRETRLVVDQPRISSRARDIDLPRREAGMTSEFRKHVENDAKGRLGIRAWARLAIIFVQHHACGIPGDFLGGKARGLSEVGVRRQQLREARGVSALHDLAETRQEGADGRIVGSGHRRLLSRLRVDPTGIGGPKSQKHDRRQNATHQKGPFHPIKHPCENGRAAFLRQLDGV